MLHTWIYSLTWHHAGNKTIFTLSKHTWSPYTPIHSWFKKLLACDVIPPVNGSYFTQNRVCCILLYFLHSAPLYQNALVIQHDVFGLIEKLYSPGSNAPHLIYLLANKSRQIWRVGGPPPINLLIIIQRAMDIRICQSATGYVTEPWSLSSHVSELVTFKVQYEKTKQVYKIFLSKLGYIGIHTQHCFIRFTLTYQIKLIGHYISMVPRHISSSWIYSIRFHSGFHRNPHCSLKYGNPQNLGQIVLSGPWHNGWRAVTIPNDCSNKEGGCAQDFIWVNVMKWHDIVELMVC